MPFPSFDKLKLGLRTFVSDVAQGFFAISHNGLAVLGLSIFFVLVALTVRPDFRAVTESKVISWLQERQDEELGIATDADAVDRATATNPRDLPKQQANLAYWLSKKYRIAPEPLSALVAEAYELGPVNQIEPTLILSVMAIESGFNPFAQSHAGAQGLMQVMTKVHEQKYQGFGGALAAFDPVANIRVGANVLKECITRAGSLEAGLKLYVGAGNQKDDQGYAAKVMAENERLQKVAKGIKVPLAPPPTTAAEAASARLEKLWEKAQRLTNFGKDSAKDEDDEAR